jgi:hypothetical protein
MTAKSSSSNDLFKIAWEAAVKSYPSRGEMAAVLCAALECGKHKKLEIYCFDDPSATQRLMFLRLEGILNSLPNPQTPSWSMSNWLEKRAQQQIMSSLTEFPLTERQREQLQASFGSPVAAPEAVAAGSVAGAAAGQHDGKKAK